MKKFLILSLTLFCLTNVVNAKVISNEKIDKQKVKVASKIITDLQKADIIPICLYLLKTAV